MTQTTTIENPRCSDTSGELVRIDPLPQVRIRPIAPSDLPEMREALETLSTTSRYRRFMHHKTSFTDAEVRELTNVDGVDHVAICAVLESPGVAPKIVGTARYYRLGDADETAEPAIIVIDPYQGRGLGEALFQRLMKDASDRGIRQFECEILASNLPMRKLVRKVSGDQARFLELDVGCLTTRFPLPASTSNRHRPTHTPSVPVSEIGRRAA